MRFRNKLVALSLALLAPVLAGQHIPVAKVETLTGTSLSLPEALHGKLGVLVIGFSRGSQLQVTDWGRKLTATYHDSPSVLYYEMPMLASVPRLLRGLVVRQMRTSVPEPAWARFAPLTEDEKTWRTLAHYAAEDDAYVLLVDGDGTVRWQTAGAPTEVAFATLKQKLTSIVPASTAAASQP